MTLTYMNLTPINLKEKHTSQILYVACAQGSESVRANPKPRYKFVALACLIETAVVETSSFILSDVCFSDRTIGWFMKITQTTKLLQRTAISFQKTADKNALCCQTMLYLSKRADLMWMACSVQSYPCSNAFMFPIVGYTSIRDLSPEFCCDFQSVSWLCNYILYV